MGWKDHSREEWQTRAELSKEFIRDDVKLGCLQRIAESLERIADLMDPEKQKEKEKEAKVRKLWAMREQWNVKGIDRIGSILERKVRDYFGTPIVGGKNLAAARTRQVGAGIYWYHPDQQPPCSEEERDRRVETWEAVDPAQVDWLQHFKPGTKGYAKALAKLKEIGHTVGMPKEEAQP